MSPPIPVSRGRRAGQWPLSWPLIPAVAWLAAFFFIPLLLILAVSFASRGLYGGVEWTFSIENYAMILDPLYGWIYVRSFVLAAATTGVCLVLGFPLAYYMARAAPRWQGVWLLLIIIPFWTNFLVRTYAWMFILRGEGLLNRALLAAGVIDAPLEILYTNTAVLIGLVYGYLPFMVLPLYAAAARLDRSLIEAAWDLYADRWSVFRRVIVPLTKPGIVAGCVLFFIPAIGAFITPDLLGGARTMMVGNLVQHEYLVIRDWPFGSAISFVLMAAVLAGVTAYLSYGRRLEELEGRR